MVKIDNYLTKGSAYKGTSKKHRKCTSEEQDKGANKLYKKKKKQNTKNREMESRLVM